MVAAVAWFLLLPLLLLWLLLVFWLLEEEVVGSPKSEAKTSSSDALLNERSGATDAIFVFQLQFYCFFFFLMGPNFV